MNSPAVFFRMAALAVAMTATGVSFANGCFQPSPTLAIEGDRYYDVPEASELSSEQRDALARLFDRIRGEWRDGTGRQLECLGTEADPEPEERDIETELEITTLVDDGLRIEEERYVIRDRIRSRETVVLFGPLSNARLSKREDNRFVAVEKYRRRNPLADGASLWEITHEFRLAGDRLDYTTTHYVNGYLAAERSRQYRRNPYRRQR